MANGNGNGSLASKVAENVWLIILARVFQVLVIPALGAALWAGVGWLADLSRTTSDTADAVAAIRREQKETNDAVSAIQAAQDKAADSIEAIEMEQRFQSVRAAEIEKKIGIESPVRWWESPQ